MIITMSPAKILNTSIVHKDRNKSNTPIYNDKAIELNNLLKKYNTSELMEMMSINPSLAQETYNYIYQFEENPNTFEVVNLYNGIAYQSLNYSSLGTDLQAYGNKHLKILSGLYGMLNPLDQIYPYRLEMQTLLDNDCGETLYDYWKTILTERLGQLLKDQKAKVWLNLASKEYTKVIDKKKLSKDIEIITPVFKETIGDKYKQIVVYVKKARGLMARYAIENKIQSSEDLKNFDCEGYTYSEHLSNDKEWVFLR